MEEQQDRSNERHDQEHDDSRREPLNVNIASDSDVEDINNAYLPPFWTNLPALWFIHAESIFNVLRIRRDVSKYSLVILALDRPALEVISDIVTHPPETDKYNTLKTTLIARFTDSRKNQIQKVLNASKLDNKKPSQLLKEMKEHGRDFFPEDFLRFRFIQCMPSHLQEFLVGSLDLTLDKLADTADRLVEYFGSSPATAVQSKESISPALNKKLGSIKGRLTRLEKSNEAMLSMLEKIMSKLDINPPSVNKNRARSRQRRSRSRSKSTQWQSEFCYYHNRFGEAANHCVRPCEFTSMLNVAF